MKISVAIGVTIAVASILACGFPANKKHAQPVVVGPNQADPEQVEKKQKPDHAKDQNKIPEIPKNAFAVESIEVDADTLITLFKENEIKANKLYKGKKLTVTGTVYRTTAQAVELKGMKLKGLSRIIALITPEDKEQVAVFQKKQTIVVVGICEGKNVDVQLSHCKFTP